ncbi:DUF1569 domain-containing protein [Rufibacter sp. LB8]|uniref:DUF1569 domain-containing protein n=1 Tax=Rufibacter sp. LB8 TaxID=2777781 RepID=UPI00178C51BC|nr:DUF1569 domain-containing protein [Rufibacter sp. LB8]
MKTIFDEAVRAELIARIQLLSPSHQPVWGKMNVSQMLQHNTYWNCWILGQGTHTYKQAFLGKVFGKIALRKMIKDEQPFDKNIPTSAQFKVTNTTATNLEPEKASWVALLKAYQQYSNPRFIHDFFGKMTKEEIGVLVYKHTDHHLRQFGV